MTLSAENKPAPKWQRILGVLVMLGGSVALCWLVVELVTWSVGPIEQRDLRLKAVLLFILWCFCFATVNELFLYWREHRRWKS